MIDKRCGTCAHSRFTAGVMNGACAMIDTAYPEFPGIRKYIEIHRDYGTRCDMWKESTDAKTDR